MSCRSRWLCCRCCPGVAGEGGGGRSSSSGAGGVGDGGDVGKISRPNKRCGRGATGRHRGREGVREGEATGAVVTDKGEDGTNKDGSAAAADIAGTTRASKLQNCTQFIATILPFHPGLAEVTGCVDRHGRG